MAQCPSKDEPSEPSLPDWLAFLKPQQAEEDPFHVKGPKLLPLGEKKEPHVITGTHDRGNLTCIGKTMNQTLVKDVSLSPTSTIMSEPSSCKDNVKEIDGTRTSNKDSENPSGTWSFWLIMLVALWSCSLLLPKSSPHAWNRSLLAKPSSQPSSTISIDGKKRPSRSTTTKSGTNSPMPQRIATMILQELSPFSSPPDQEMTPTIASPWKSADTERIPSPLSDDATIERSNERKRPTVEDLTVTMTHSQQELDQSLADQSNMYACDHSWQWILHRSCRVQRRRQQGIQKIGATTTTPLTVDQLLVEPCLNWLSRDCRVQKRAIARSSSSRRTMDGNILDSHHNPSEPIFKEQTVKAVQSLLEAAYQTHKLMNLWIQEELETSNFVEPRNNKYE